MLADLARRDVVAFDLFGDLDLRRRASRVVTGGGLSELVEAALAEPPGGVVYGASFENHLALVARLAERHALLGNVPETLRAVRDPVGLGATLRDAGFPFPRTSVSAVPERTGAWLRKPLRGGGGTRVRDWRGGALPRGTFVQQRIAGLACSAAAVGDGRSAVMLGVSEQLIGRRELGARGYAWCGNLVPPRLDEAQRRALAVAARTICAHLAHAFGLRGLFGVDLVWDGDRAWVVEVNPRPTGSLECVEAAYDVGVFAAHLEGCAGHLPAVALAPSPGRAAGKAILFATRDVRLGDTSDWRDRGIRDVPHPRERIRAGGPICTLVSVQDSPEAVLADLEARAAALRVELGERAYAQAGS